MKYTISIKGMHCSGCQNLIKMTLEDLGYSEIEVRLEAKNARFKSEKPITKVETELQQTFKIDLQGYSYSNLVVI